MSFAVFVSRRRLGKIEAHDFEESSVDSKFTTHRLRQMRASTVMSKYLSLFVFLAHVSGKTTDTFIATLL